MEMFESVIQSAMKLIEMELCIQPPLQLIGTSDSLKSCWMYLSMTSIAQSYCHMVYDGATAILSRAATKIFIV